jgi:hypothetical protein
VVIGRCYLIIPQEHVNSKNHYLHHRIVILKPIKEAILIPISKAGNVLILGHKRKMGKKAFLFFSFYAINIDGKKHHRSWR